MRFCGRLRDMEEERRRGGPPWPPASDMFTPVTTLRGDRHGGLSLRTLYLQGPVRFFSTAFRSDAYRVVCVAEIDLIRARLGRLRKELQQ